MTRRSLGLFWVLVSLLVFLLGHPSTLALNLGRSVSEAQMSSDLVFPDYLERDGIIRNYEQQVRQSPDSFLLLRSLADQYLKRFRERADVEDLLRAEQAAQRSIALQPRQNGGASMLLASTLLSQHRFQEALQVVTDAEKSVANDQIASLKASIQMELGDYEAAHQFLQTLTGEDDNSGHDAVLARYLELTSHLSAARQQMDSAMQQMDQFYTNPAETRAWFHVRSGDLAFLAGDLTRSEQRYQEAIALFPYDVAAFTGLARLYAAQHRWQACLEAANQGIDRVPLVETLAYKADAQQALGDSQGAAATQDLIEVVAHLSQVKGIYDRALAVYYIEHGVHLPEALEIAQREVALRDDIYAEDTLAWAAAANGQWQIAERAIQQATRYGTEDPLLRFHHGMIALHKGDRETAIRQLGEALRLNPQFHHKYAAEARQVLANLSLVK
ncbi:tetratricopeptide repeat protein [Phormidesmis priestleyi]